jgi:hypothetical protein
MHIPTGVDDCGRNILRADVAFAEVSFIHAKQQLEEPAGSNVSFIPGWELGKY